MRLIMATTALCFAMAAAAGADQQHSPTGTHMKVSGEVTKVQSGVAFVKTPWGSMTFSATSGLEGLKPGEEVEMWVNENNAVIDVHRKGESHPSHRYVTGNLTYTAADHKEIKLKTPEGEISLPVDRGRSKLSVLEEGTPVTVELNEAGRVIDVHRFNVDLQIEDQPRTKPGDHLTVTGVVDKIQSGLVYVKTPVGRYTISAKTAPKDAAVGDEVTLWLNEDNLVIDHHGTSKHTQGAHRLITGKLIYAGKTKQEIKLWTPEGERTFPLERMEVKTKPIEEGTRVTVELNEQGSVIDLWKTES